MVRTICDLVVGTNKPDLTILLSASSEFLSSRRDQRGTSDRFEKMDQSFHDRVNEGYIEEAKRLRLSIIDASPDIETIANEIWQLVEPLMKEGE
jgi:dTMP kinase